MHVGLSPVRFGELLMSVCDRETSADPDGWTPQNPLWGHCAVVALVAQDYFGGDLQRASLEGTPYAAMRSHYANRIAHNNVGPFPSLQWWDFTDLQFEGNYPPNLKWELRQRAYVISPPATRRRYKLLAFRVARKLVDETGTMSPIFDDPIYQRVYDIALDSPCQKMRFGCVITRNDTVVYAGPNQTIAPLASMCEGTCIRFGITSRTESMIGSCAHAEEGMWDVIQRGIPIWECELYVAGLHMNGLPWIKTAPEHTCLRCAVQMHHARLQAVHVPMNGGWAKLTTEQAIETARAYAMQEKKA